MDTAKGILTEIGERKKGRMLFSAQDALCHIFVAVVSFTGH